METGKWKFENGNRELENGNSKIENGELKSPTSTNPTAYISTLTRHIRHVYYSRLGGYVKSILSRWTFAAGNHFSIPSLGKEGTQGWSNTPRSLE
jgi:hypothetical protein